MAKAKHRRKKNNIENLYFNVMYYIRNVIKELTSFFLNFISTLAAVADFQWGCGGGLLTAFPKVTA